MQKQPFPVGGGSKKFEDWGGGGLKKFRTEGVTDLGGSLFWGDLYSLHVKNMIAYGGIFLKKQSAEYAIILNVSNEVHCIRSLYKLLSSYRDRHIQNTVKHLRWSVLQKQWYLNAGAQPGIFQGKGERFVELGHLDKDFIRNTRKRGSAGKYLGVFSPRCS